MKSASPGSTARTHRPTSLMLCRRRSYASSSAWRSGSTSAKRSTRRLWPSRRRIAWSYATSSNGCATATTIPSTRGNRFVQDLSIRSLDVLTGKMLSRCPRSLGEVPERSNGAVSKTVVPLAGDRGFESLPLRQHINDIKHLQRNSAVGVIQRTTQSKNPPIGGGPSKSFSRAHRRASQLHPRTPLPPASARGPRCSRASRPRSAERRSQRGCLTYSRDEGLETDDPARLGYRAPLIPLARYLVSF